MSQKTNNKRDIKRGTSSSSSRSSSSSSSSSSCSRERSRSPIDVRKQRKNQFDEFDLESRNPDDKRRKVYSHGSRSHNDDRKRNYTNDDDDDEDIDGVPIKLPEKSFDSIRSDKSSVPTLINYRSTEGSKGGGTSFDDEGNDQMPDTPAPPIISKTHVQFGKRGTLAKAGIQMKLGASKPKPESSKKITVASAFNNDSEDEVEEMPPECKMRMRNIGRDTPTSSGPNSFGKTKQGFVDTKKVFERSLREACAD